MISRSPSPYWCSQCSTSLPDLSIYAPPRTRKGHTLRLCLVSKAVFQPMVALEGLDITKHHRDTFMEEGEMLARPNRSGRRKGSFLTLLHGPDTDATRRLRKQVSRSNCKEHSASCATTDRHLTLSLSSLNLKSEDSGPGCLMLLGFSGLCLRRSGATSAWVPRAWCTTIVQSVCSEQGNITQWDVLASEDKWLNRNQHLGYPRVSQGPGSGWAAGTARMTCKHTKAHAPHLCSLHSPP